MASRTTKAAQARRAALLTYCRIAPEELDAAESALIDSLYGAALAYLTQSGVAEPEADSPRRAQYDLLVDALVLEAYDRRDMMSVGGAVQENPAFRRILNQLKLSGPPVRGGGPGETQ